MFKKGQLVRGTVSERYYRVLYEHNGRVLVRNARNNYMEWIGTPFVELIGNNYTAKKR